MRNKELPLARRMQAAIAALPFEHPKLVVVATTTTEDLSERLERAKAASMKVLGTRQVIEAPKPVDEVPDHSKPFARLRRLQKELAREAVSRANFSGSARICLSHAEEIISG